MKSGFTLIREEPVCVYLATGLRAYQIRMGEPDLMPDDLDDEQATDVDDGVRLGADCFVTGSEGADGFVWDTVADAEADLAVWNSARHERVRRLRALRELEGRIRQISTTLWVRTVDDPDTATAASEAAETDPERLKIRVAVKLTDLAAELVEAIAEDTLTGEFVKSQVISRVAVLAAQIAAMADN